MARGFEDTPCEFTAPYPAEAENSAALFSADSLRVSRQLPPTGGTRADNGGCLSTRRFDKVEENRVEVDDGEDFGAIGPVDSGVHDDSQLVEDVACGAGVVEEVDGGTRGGGGAGGNAPNGGIQYALRVDDDEHSGEELDREGEGRHGVSGEDDRGEVACDENAEYSGDENGESCLFSCAEISVKSRASDVRGERPTE